MSRSPFFYFFIFCTSNQFIYTWLLYYSSHCVCQSCSMKCFIQWGYYGSVLFYMLSLLQFLFVVLFIDCFNF